MSRSENNHDRRGAPISSRIYSEPIERSVPGRPRTSQVNPVRIVEEAVWDIRDNVSYVSWNRDSASDSEPHPNIIIEHVFPFMELDHSLLADKNRTTKFQSSLISNKSNLFVNVRTNSILGDMA